MKHHLIKLILNNAPLKIVSFVCGYAIWAGLAPHRIIEKTFEVPLSFYATDHAHTLQAPETVSITLRGKRNDMRGIDPEALAAHIQADELELGSQAVSLKESDLLLPESIKLVHYTPHQLIVTKHSETSATTQT